MIVRGSFVSGLHYHSFCGACGCGPTFTEYAEAREAAIAENRSLQEFHEQSKRNRFVLMPTLVDQGHRHDVYHHDDEVCDVTFWEPRRGGRRVNILEAEL